MIYRLYLSLLRILLSYIWGSLLPPFISLVRVESKAVCLIGNSFLDFYSLLSISLPQGCFSFHYALAVALVTALTIWLPVFHLQWLGHIPLVRHHLPTFVMWNFPTRELIGSLTVSSNLLLTCGTLFLFLYFGLPLTFFPSKGRSITT